MALSFVGSLLAVTLLVFLLVRLMPGDIASIHNLGPATQASLYLDRSVPVQYLFWLGNALTLDFGISLVDGTPVRSLLAEYTPPTLFLAFGSLAASLLLALPLGLFRGIRPASPLGKWLAALVYSASSIPAFVLGYIVLALFFGVFKVYITSVPDADSGFGVRATYYLIPIFVLALGNGSLGEFIRFISLEAQNVNGSMFLKAARARGAPLGIHFLKSMVLPLFNVVGTNLAVLLGGIVVVERIFNFRGLGWLSWEATLKRDFSVLMGIVVVMALLIRLFMLVGDLLAAWLDPRLRT